jgi:hypothetical protein
MVADELASSQKELEVIAKEDLSSTTGRLLLVTRKYEVMHDNYQHVAARLSQSFSELKAEMDSHGGTKAQLAAAAAELIVARVDAVDAVMEVEEATNQLFGTTTELIASQDDIGIIEGLYRRRNVQHAIDKQSEEDRSFFQKINALTSGEKKWKNLACQLFRVQILRPFLMTLSADNIRNKTYTKKSIARVIDMHHGFNLCGLDAMRLVEPVYLGDKRLLWSSSSIKRFSRQIEKEMQHEI